MFFKKVNPPADLSTIIECFWIAEDSAKAIRQQKIIPDGFTELIFHFGDPYRIRLGDRWQIQTRNLLAGQIDRHFILENTGSSSMVAVKMKPAALAHLFQLEMRQYTNEVVDITTTPEIDMEPIIQKINSVSKWEPKIEWLTEYFRKKQEEKKGTVNPAEKAVDLLFEKHGMLTVSDLCGQLGIGERQLEYIFKKYVGLSPKRYARILRFNYIFHLVENRQGWSDIAYEAAFYDQSHFIRNFKHFTGESPSAYAFDEKTMANFFLKKD